MFLFVLFDTEVGSGGGTIWRVLDGTASRVSGTGGDLRAIDVG
jgi:hypothetical protein